MNGRKAKALRRAVAHLPDTKLRTRGVSLTGRLTDGRGLFDRMFTAVYPAGSRRRVYQDSKRG